MLRVMSDSDKTSNALVTHSAVLSSLWLGLSSRSAADVLGGTCKTYAKMKQKTENKHRQEEGEKALFSCIVFICENIPVTNVWSNVVLLKLTLITLAYKKSEASRAGVLLHYYYVQICFFILFSHCSSCRLFILNNIPLHFITFKINVLAAPNVAQPEISGKILTIATRISGMALTVSPVNQHITS